MGVIFKNFSNSFLDTYFAGHGVRKKRTLKIPILTTNDTYFTSVKEDTSHLYDPITYTPTALEVPIYYV